MKEIGSIYLQRMNNGAHFTFVKNMLAKAEANTAVATKAKTQLDALRKAVEAEDEQLKLSQKSTYSDEIAQADAERDSLYNGYKTSVRTFQTMPIPEMQQAARTLAQHIKDYRINPDAQYDQETGLLMNFIDDLQKKYTAQVTTLNLTSVVEKMKEANERVNQYIIKREDERTATNVGAMKAARKNTDDAYNMMVKMVNALALVYGEEEYATFIDYANVSITRYKREVLRQTATKPGTEGTPDTGGDTPGTGGDTPGTGGDTPGTGTGGDTPTTPDTPGTGGGNTGGGGDDDNEFV